MRYLSVLIILLLAFSNSQAVILCIGEDGHIAVEVASSDCCTNPPVGTSKADVTIFVDDSHSEDDDCGSCVDIPLFAGGAYTLTAAEKENPSHITTAAMGPLPVEAIQTSGLGLVLESFTPTAYFTPLRSVILLI
jgi:hypothetical protein